MSSVKYSSAERNKSELRRIALSLQYDGTNFCGWQRQSTGLSIQQVLEEAILKLDPLRPIKAFAAGRTDAGVHAAGQVVHFDCCGPIPASRWSSALNGRLPEAIRVREAVNRPMEGHACYSACYRRYRYTIYNGRKPNIFIAPWCWHKYQFQLDEDLMLIALEGLLGTHDFSAFERAGSKRSNAFTTIQAVNLERQGDFIFLEIQASGFLYGMVRLLVGQLVAVGEHKLSINAFEKRWKQKRREEVKDAAPAKGLCLIRAGYEDLIFSEAAWYDSHPKYRLGIMDPPNAPPLL